MTNPTYTKGLRYKAIQLRNYFNTHLRCLFLLLGTSGFYHWSDLQSRVLVIFSIVRHDVDQDDDEGEDETKQEPDVNILDVSGGW